MIAAPTMEVVAAVIVDGAVLQAAHDAPLFYGRRLSALSDFTARLGVSNAFH
jgi:hypothetical protein